MTTPIDHGAIHRRILEELPEAAKSSPAKPFVNYRYLTVATQYPSDLILGQLEILEFEERVELRRLDDECAVKLKPLWWKSLGASRRRMGGKNVAVHIEHGSAHDQDAASW